MIPLWKFTIKHQSSAQCPSDRCINQHKRRNIVSHAQCISLSTRAYSNQRAVVQFSGVVHSFNFCSWFSKSYVYLNRAVDIRVLPVSFIYLTVFFFIEIKFLFFFSFTKQNVPYGFFLHFFFIKFRSICDVFVFNVHRDTSTKNQTVLNL